MPEWPDLHVLKGRLEAALVGRAVLEAAVFNPIVLPTVMPMDPMLTGHFALSEPKAKRTKDTAFTVTFEGGVQLRYRDEKQMGKVHLLSSQDVDAEVLGYAELGPEADPATFDEQDFIARGRKRQYEVRNLLMDQAFLAGIGNAYADEILFEARLHPKRKLSSLSEEEWACLARSVRSVIAAGVRAARRRPRGRSTESSTTRPIGRVVRMIRRWFANELPAAMRKPAVNPEPPDRSARTGYHAPGPVVGLVEIGPMNIQAVFRLFAHMSARFFRDRGHISSREMGRVSPCWSR